VNDAQRARFREGDPTLFRRLVETESGILLRYAESLCGDPDEAEDLVQDTWIAAYRERMTFQGRSALLSWLLAICRSRFLSARRKTAHRDRILAAQPSFAPGDLALAADAGADPFARRRLAEAIADLPDRQRDVVILRLVDGLSTKECAARLGIPEGTVKSSLSRGLDSLKPLLEDLRP
jgi:RNA polymerase sigma-70 factor, ECF subfamily